MKLPFFSKLFAKNSASPAQVPEREGVYLTQTVTFGNHLYRRPGDDPSVYFVDTGRGIHKKLVDYNGRICRFPGIVKEAFWVQQVSANALKPQIRFRTDFIPRDEGWLMCWTIQPDGRYWADEDGFGMENEEEVVLYTCVDKNGDFTGPFRIYSVGMRSFYKEAPHETQTL